MQTQIVLLPCYNSTIRLELITFISVEKTALMVAILRGAYPYCWTMLQQTDNQKKIKPECWDDPEIGASLALSVPSLSREIICSQVTCSSQCSQRPKNWLLRINCCQGYGENIFSCTGLNLALNKTILNTVFFNLLMITPSALLWNCWKHITEITCWLQKEMAPLSILLLVSWSRLILKVSLGFSCQSL